MSIERRELFSAIFLGAFISAGSEYSTATLVTDAVNIADLLIEALDKDKLSPIEEILVPSLDEVIK